MQLNMNKLSGNSRKLTSYGDSSFTEDFSLVFLAHRLLRENQKPKLIIRGLEKCLAGKWVFWFMVVFYHSLKLINNTGKWITGTLSCPFRTDLSSQPILSDLPDFSLYEWFTAYEIPSTRATRATFSWLMVTELALHLKEIYPKVGRPSSGWSRAFGDDGQHCWPKYTPFPECQEKSEKCQERSSPII